jgi:hypothetical protein
MKKTLLIGAGVVVAFLALGIFLVITGLDDLVNASVEQGGSQATKVKVTLDGAEIDIGEGRATLNGLTVGNPDGFQSDSAFHLGSISVTIDPASVASNPIVIREAIVQSPEITYEIGPGGSNIDVIRRNAAQMAANSSSGGGSRPAEEGATVIIEHLYIRGASVVVTAAALGGKSMASSLPDMHLTDIGRKQGGADPAIVAAEIMTAVTGRVSGYVSGLDLSGVLRGVENLPESLRGLTGDAGNKAGDAVKGATEGAGGAVKKLFGN